MSGECARSMIGTSTAAARGVAGIAARTLAKADSG